MREYASSDANSIPTASGFNLSQQTIVKSFKYVHAIHFEMNLSWFTTLCTLPFNSILCHQQTIWLSQQISEASSNNHMTLKEGTTNKCGKHSVIHGSEELPVVEGVKANTFHVITVRFVLLNTTTFQSIRRIRFSSKNVLDWVHIVSALQWSLRRHTSKETLSTNR